MPNTTNTTSYLDPPSLIGRQNNDGTISLTPLELKRLNDFNYAIAKMVQGGLNLANLNTDTNQVFTDIEGNVTTLQATANGLQSQVTEADGKASSAKQTADGVQVEVDGLKSRNTVTIDSTGLYVTNAAGQATKLSGNQITSGTIAGVTLISSGTGAKITVSDGSISFSGGGGTSKLTQTSRTGLYIEAGSVSGQGISISTDSFNVSANDSISLSSPVYISSDLNVAQNINSNGVMKLNAGSNASFDANGTLYLGTSNGENVEIGSSGARINLNGDVYLNGSPLTAGSST